MKPVYNPRQNRYIPDGLVHDYGRLYHESPELEAESALSDPMYCLEARLETPIGYDAESDSGPLERLADVLLGSE